MPAWLLLGFEARVAVRFLREGRLQTVLIVVGVAAGVAVVAFISALVAGLQKNTFDKTLGGQPHVTLQALDDRVLPARSPEGGQTVFSDTQAKAQRARSVADWQALLPVLDRWPGVAAVSPLVTGGGLAMRADATQSIALSGVELARYDQVVRLREKVVQGVARLEPGEAIIGVELASDLGLRAGDRMTVSSGPVSETVRVSALVDLGVRELNRRTVIVPLRLAQSLLGLPGGATSLELALRDVWSASELAAQLRRQFPYEVQSWQQTNAQLVSALHAQSVATGLIRLIVLMVVVLGIASVLVVTVVQKQREIGILRAMGATRGQMVRVFLLQGGIVGALGSVLGLALARLMILAFGAFARGSDGAPLFLIAMPAVLAAQVALVASVCGVLAAIAPARRAAAMAPAQAIRL